MLAIHDTFKNTNLFTHGPVYAYTECCTQTLLHTDAFTQKHLDTEPHLKSNGNGRFGPKPSKNPFGTRFYTFAPCGPAIGFPFWDQGETLVFSHILARSLLEPACGTFAACGPATKRAFWDQGETAIFSQILAEAFWTQLLRLSRLAGRQLKVPSDF